MVTLLRRTALCALAVTTVAPLLWSCPSALATDGHRAPLVGINVRAPYGGESAAAIRQELAYARQLNADVVRVELSWARFEPIAKDVLNRPTVAATDAFMRDAGNDHLKVIAMLDRTPCWASSAPPPVLAGCGGGSEAAYAWPPRDASWFGAFAGWLAHRYAKRLAAVEVWNEPDQENEHYLAGPEKPRHDAELLKAAYPTVKAANDKIAVLAGSVVGSNGAFMEALYAQRINGFYNGVAVHFYTLVLASVRRFREVQAQNGDRTPLWLDEFGWSSCWPTAIVEQEQGCVTRRVQAENFATSIRELSQAPYVAALVPYKLQNTPTEAFGVLTGQGGRKPAFAALANAFASPFSTVRGISLRLSLDAGRIRVVVRAPVGDYMQLEAASSSWRYKAIFTLNRFNKYDATLPAALGVKGVQVRVWQYWRGPAAGVEGDV